MFNRDELRTRPLAGPPALRRVGSRLAAYPVDPQSGGTWIAANDAGVVLALLNRTDTPGPPRGAARSRGAIIPTLLHLERAEDIVRRCRWLTPSTFAPFYLAVLSPSRWSLVTSDGQGISVKHLNQAQPLLWTTSSLGDQLVDRPRRELFERMLSAATEDRSGLQRAFHEHRWARHPELSVYMSRADARTVSRTTIEVSQRRFRMRYQPLPSETRPAAIAS